jgi:hypothetical protein
MCHGFVIFLIALLKGVLGFENLTGLAKNKKVVKKEKETCLE